MRVWRAPIAPGSCLRSFTGVQQQLQQKERIALGALDAARDQRRRHRRRQRRQAQRIGGTERAEVDADHRCAVQGRAPRPRRRVAGEARRHDQQQRLAGGELRAPPAAEGQDRPVDVLDPNAAARRRRRRRRRRGRQRACARAVGSSPRRERAARAAAPLSSRSSREELAIRRPARKRRATIASRRPASSAFGRTRSASRQAATASRPVSRRVETATCGRKSIACAFAMTRRPAATCRPLCRRERSPGFAYARRGSPIARSRAAPRRGRPARHPLLRRDAPPRTR